MEEELNSTESCPCNSGLTFKDCHLELLRAAGRPLTAANVMRYAAQEKMAMQPRGGDTWREINRVLNDICVTQLASAPLEEFNPVSVIDELFFAYTLLKMDYWGHFHHHLLDPEVRESPEGSALPTMGDMNIPYYVRGLLLCFNQLLPMCGAEEYNCRPPIPPQYQLSRFYPDTFVMLKPREFFCHFLDSLTNNLGNEIHSFFNEVLAPPEGDIQFLKRVVYFPVPLANYREYITFANNLLALYKEHFFAAQKQFTAKKDDAMAGLLPSQELQDKFSPKLKPLIEQYREKGRKIFDQDPEFARGDAGGVVSISKQAVKDLAKEYPSLQENLQEIFDEMIAAIKREVIPGYYTFPFEQLFDLEIFDSPDFGRIIFGAAADFLIEIYTQFATPQQDHEFRAACDVLKYFFTNYSVLKDGAHVEEYGALESNLSEAGIPLANFRKLVTNYANLPRKNALDLFNRPFFLCPDGYVRFSVPILLDALVYHYISGLQRQDIGSARAMRAENYVGFLISNFLKERYPEFGKDPLFKLILRNARKTQPSKGLKSLMAEISAFKFPIITIDVEEGDLGTPFTFFEYDLLFLFGDVIVVVNVKDDLFWETKDLPVPVILWGHLQREKQELQVKYLNAPAVKTVLAEQGIQYSRVETLVVTQGHIFCSDFQCLHNLYDVLERIHWGEGHVTTYTTRQYPPYPWK